MKTGVFNFLAQDRVHFGVSAADGIATEVAQRGANRLFVVTSRSLNRNTSVVTEVLLPVKDKVVGLFHAYPVDAQDGCR
jgi:maleylacetate reductase